MTFLRLFIFFIYKGFSAGSQLWRAEGDFNEEVYDVFYERARYTDDIWLRNKTTIDFVVEDIEVPYVIKFLNRNNVSHTVLQAGVEETTVASRRRGILTAENGTTLSTGVQLWRAQGYFNESVLEEFYERAHFTKDMWKRNPNTIDFLVDGEEIPIVMKFLKKNNITYKVLKKNIEGRVDNDMVKNIATRRSAVVGDTFTWTSYPSLSEINRYLVRIASTNPAYCKLTALRKTLGRRAINMLKISNAGFASVLVVGGMHGRDKTAILSTLYFIESIAANLTKQPDYIKKTDWYIIPVLNPDGYEYAVSKDRTWRKNTRKFSGSCFGVDINRNFDYNWCTKFSFQPICSPTYCGPEPFSEEESKAIKNLVDGTRFHGYISMHSPGTRVVFPTTSKADYRTHRLLQVTKEIALAMRKISHNDYVNKNVQEIGADAGAGMAIDWMLNAKQVPHAYMIQTLGSGSLDYLVKTEILIAVKEVREGLFKFAEIVWKPIV